LYKSDDFLKKHVIANKYLTKYYIDWNTCFRLLSPRIIRKIVKKWEMWGYCHLNLWINLSCFSSAWGRHAWNKWWSVEFFFFLM